MTARRRERIGGLPATANNFVGRDRELEDISLLLLKSARLVTLTGPGGIGKTRLAAEAVLRFKKAMSTPVYWVRLARLVRDSETLAVEDEIARAVVETDLSERSSWELIIDTFGRYAAALRRRRIVLVLDNCEHIVASAAAVIEKLIDAVPELTIVATSREPIGWIDEYLVNVRPLAVGHAITLFRHHAELAGRPVTGSEQSTVATICRRVDNHPLHIQLAAARLRHQPLASILRELTGRADDARLRWSHGPRYGADARHRGVTDAIAWSYELCTDEERLLFDRMSVFAAGYDTNADSSCCGTVIDVGADLHAIEAVCSDDYAPDSGTREHLGDSEVQLTVGRIEDLLESLVGHSLVTVHLTSTTVRYSLVESLRVYAQLRLHERSTGGIDEPARMAHRHLLYYQNRIAYAAANWFDCDGNHNLSLWAQSAWTNTVTAIENSLNTGQATIGLELCLGLVALRMPFIRGSLRQMRQWAEQCLEASKASTSTSPQLQVEAMATIAWLALTQGDHACAELFLNDCIAACVTDETDQLNWRNKLVVDTGLPPIVEFAWAMELLFVQRSAHAVPAFIRARDKFEHIGNRRGAAALSDLYAAMAAGLLGTGQQAHEITQRFLDSARNSRIPRLVAWAEHARAIALTKHGNPIEALNLERTSLAYKLTSGDLWGSMWVVECRIWSLARLITDSFSNGDEADSERLVSLATEIAHLAGGVDFLRTKLGVDIDKMGPYGDESARAIAVARQVIGPDRYTAAATRGSRLRPEDNEVQRLALGTLIIEETAKDEIRDTDPTERWLHLTAAEQQVATLAAAGWTNTAIAARRGSSVRTVDAQVAAILSKLVISSREDIIGMIPRNVIDEVGAEAARRPPRTKLRLPRSSGHRQ
ncbi:AAA family ATPase [Nocardia sp. NPDC004168]|uniref:ATP-binding protein n=1 Tax=Nocardia sp. NPDC004168 TaxID=3154452 RepID=UPI0033B6CAE1